MSSAEKIKKSDDPDVGSYDAPLAFKNTQTNGIETKGFKIDKGKGKTFTEMVAAKSKFVPGPGTYK
jgi:hypothetical protein